MDDETPGLDPADVKQAVKVLRGTLNAWAYAHDQTLKHLHGKPYRRRHDERRRELTQQWDTVKRAMEGLGF